MTSDGHHNLIKQIQALALTHNPLADTYSFILAGEIYEQTKGNFRVVTFLSDSKKLNLDDYDLKKMLRCATANNVIFQLNRNLELLGCIFIKGDMFRNGSLTISRSSCNVPYEFYNQMWSLGLTRNAYSALYGFEFPESNQLLDLEKVASCHLTKVAEKTADDPIGETHSLDKRTYIEMCIWLEYCTSDYTIPQMILARSGKKRDIRDTYAVVMFGRRLTEDDHQKFDKAYDQHVAKVARKNMTSQSDAGPDTSTAQHLAAKLRLERSSKK